MKKTLAALLACSTAHGQLIDDIRIFDATFTSFITDSRLDEISGLFALRNESNEGKFIVCHDSDSQYMYVIDDGGDVQSKVNLVNKSWSDAEEITGYTDEDGTNYIILCEFGDNPGTRDVKNLFRFVEPETNDDVDISDYDTISYRLPADVVLESGTNRGDFEGAFACPRDGKIYMFTKRMPTNLIFSLPIQDNYSGILTATYEGEMSATVSEETGGVISPANCVAACVTKCGNHALIKTYNMIYRFGRPVDTTWVEAFQTLTPTIVSVYVGRGPAPFQEPQGESICFSATDEDVHTISEFRGSNQATFFRYSVQKGDPTPPDLSLPSKPNPTFQTKYVHEGAHTHRFTVTDGFQWTLQASTNLRDWEEVDSPFTFVPKDDGTTDYIYTRQDKAREFFRYAVTSIDFIDYVYESTLAAMENSDPNTSDVLLYDSDGNRNPDNFMNSLQGVTGIVAYNNKASGNGNLYHGCAITPRHLLSCKHARYSVGDEVTFLTSDNVPITRTITHLEVPPGASHEVDFVVYLLDSDLPATIKPLEMLGGNTLNYITGDPKIVIRDRSFPNVWVNQDERVGVNQLWAYYMRRLEDPFPNSYEGNPFDHAMISSYITDPDEEDNIWDEWRLIGRGGDSGSINMIVMGDKLVVNSIMTQPAGGPWFGQLINFNTIKMMIDLVDGKAGIDSGYTVQTPDMNGFNEYSK